MAMILTNQLHRYVYSFPLEPLSVKMLAEFYSHLQFKKFLQGRRVLLDVEGQDAGTLPCVLRREESQLFDTKYYQATRDRY